ncbi:hypothetical protein ICM_05066 [Bacillus cereus BAG1X2-3]|uniref:HipA family kinase n=2 Tax=Bacillus cereus TaxID=1396 RepID=UPI0003305A3D|nr:HipA family kinase [Bacillus cereus]EOO23510.1 hypothetical protein ICC_05974 [Bacillus cereus BAG1X1-1]EOO47348.1 hypothetical protein ICK_05184 [Bacillus cereus BAG1X2-2]EOO54812.1 hypothetical protein ICI_00174 [Bacillus cereus BAG1X2-1]EOO63613.1 hypothetical protein ICM_05066 [Bacillus cereus BAG1X2-3]EOP10986.1 hypothetical protein ICO_00176 [Bacillus cereus BAG2O-1]
MKQLRVEAFIRMLGSDQGGMSRPVIVLADDGQEYILKNQNVYDPRINQWVTWNSMYVHEALSWKIANHIDAPIPDCAVLEVDNIFLDAHPELRFNSRITSGKHFGSLVIENPETNLQQGFAQLQASGKPYRKNVLNNYYSNVANGHAMANIVALDMLTLNFDRFTNDGNLLVASPNGIRNIYAIDHGHCFASASWDVNRIQWLNNIGLNLQQHIDWIINQYFVVNGQRLFGSLGEVFKAMEQHIDLTDPTCHSFQPIVNSIERITEVEIQSWLSSIPDEWFVQRLAQSNYYIDFLILHKNIVKILINILYSQGAFTNTLGAGGALEWIDVKTGTQ